MAATTTAWSPRTNMSPKTWLLTNGEIVSEPALEESSSGRKVRIAGTNTSMFSKDVDELVFEGVQHVAKSKGVAVWMALDEKARKDQEHSKFDGAIRRGVKPELHLLKQNQYGNQSTVVSFRFRHDTLPIEAVLAIHVGTSRSRYGRGAGQVTVGTTLVMPSTIPLDARSVELIEINDEDMSGITNRLRTHDDRLKFTELLRDHKPSWLSELPTQEVRTPGDRPAAKQFREWLEVADSFETISIPDLRDPQAPAWLELRLHETNLTGEFRQTLADYLDGTNVVTQVREHWQEIVRLLRSTGLVLPEPDETAWGSALAGGEPVTVQIENQPNEINHGQDYNHSVTLHLPTGTLVVACTNSAVNNNEVALKWDEALTMASLTGQEDELLAYARRYKETAADRRSEAIIKERKTL